MKRSVKGNVSWIGKSGWERKKFHSNEYSTWRGTSYNSYLLEEEKIALIDTVWKAAMDGRESPPRCSPRQRGRQDSNSRAMDSKPS